MVLEKSESPPAQGQQLQLEQTSDATSVLHLCCRYSVCDSGEGNLDVWHPEFPELPLSPF